MAAINVTVYEADTGASLESDATTEYKEIIAMTELEAKRGETVSINLTEHGITTLEYIRCGRFSPEVSTPYMTWVAETPESTSVTAGVLTVTINTDNTTPNDQQRIFLIGGF